MQTPSFNIKLLHNFISKQLKANMKKTNRPKLDFLSLVRKHNELTNEQKTAPIVSPSNISSFIANRGLSKQINQKLKSQTLAELDLSRYKFSMKSAQVRTLLYTLQKKLILIFNLH